MKDEQGRYVYMSKNAEDRFGIRFNDVRGCTDFQIWPQEFAEVFRKNDLKVLESGQPIDVEETAGFNGNLSIWWNFRFPFRDAAGQRYVGGIGVEITQRREAENELKRTQSNIAAIIESTEDMIWSVDLKYRMVTFNSALQKHVLRTYGMNVFIGAEPEDFLPRDRAETWVSTYVRALSEGPFRMEYTLADGRILEISCNVILQDGQTAGISVFAKDITERKLIETALQESEERFRRAVVVAPFPVMMHAEDGEILAVSNKLIELTGYAFEDINTVQKWTEKVYARKSPVMYEHIQKLFERDRIDEGIELDIITRNGNTLNWFFRASPLGRLSDGRKLLISMAVDITERKRIEEERIERKSAERAMDKVLMDIHDGIGGITTNISLISELAKKKTSTPMIIEEALNTISDLARDGMAEIRSLMYSLDREDLDWHSLVIELRSQGIKLLEPHSIEFNMTTEVKEEIPNPSSHLCLTLFRIYREALLNVLKHAKATRVTVTFHVDREHLTIVIRDNGQGFRHSALTRNGRGIGNMMTRAVEMHGTVTVTGEGGTKVAIEFPLSSK
jgi:PAS domain S-box-containing protein